MCNKEEWVHCPNCPDQGWYAGRARLAPRYEYNSDTGEEVFLGLEYDWEQEQCEFCWTVENSYFNKVERLKNVVSLP
jgi:hypothetical protein